MDFTEHGRIDAPHRDMEHGIPRAPIEYLMALPEQGLNADTGLIFLIDGYGMSPDDPYNVHLRRYVASGYNCIAVGVFYFGNRLMSGNHCKFEPGPDFFVNLKTHHGIQIEAPRNVDMDSLVRQLCQAIAQNGGQRLDRSCWVVRRFGDEYESSGLLPAMDHLQVLGYLLNRYPLNRNRLFVLGSSMGGYIGQMMGKLAPHTFRAIIDNSGQVQSEDLRRTKIGFRYGLLEGVEIRACEFSPWEADPASPHCYREHHRLIRDLRIVSHMREGYATFRRLYHSVEDAVVPLTERMAFSELAADFSPTSLECIDLARVDGLMFKSLDHGMKASMLHLLDDGLRALADRGLDQINQPTDFCRESRHRFDCGQYCYLAEYSRTGEISVSMAPTG